jgi:tetratricopeptide (TPR) repeat protein
VNGQLIGFRYQLLEPLGQGSMGTVYKAIDRLNRQPVALKRVASVPGTADTEKSAKIRLTLADEFQTLASLHHPHVINVLDYGFDAEKQPYFTMSLLEGAQAITRAGEGQPVLSKVRLLIQLLEALTYLHRRGIIHRDLKPDNALVTAEGEVKVLDFGLAVLRERMHQRDELSGTLTYMAPEVLRGAPVSAASDLYAVGVIAYEMMAGRHPFPQKNFSELLQAMISTPVDISQLEVEPKIGKVIERLLAKKPEMRYRDAEEGQAALSEASGEARPQESVAIRESFLQAARFVGRDQELGLLTAALGEAINGRGSTWLVGGESGVGKSRLLDELRTQALVRGALVLYGQGVAENASLPYNFWREPLRRLALSVGMSETAASVIKQIVPDLSDLLERPIPDAPELEGQAGQTRLLTTATGLFRCLPQPTVLVLDDLQWATESLDLLRLLVPITEQLPLLIVGNYRDDERPHLADELPDVKTIKLERLSEASIAQLSASMLGAAGQEANVLELLNKETEGNVFFLVEVVRALAEEAGRLSDIGRMSLPRHVLAGGVAQIVQRRLNRIPSEARPLLNAAAIGGRQLDLAMLHVVARGKDLEPWLTACSNAAVLESRDGQWRFAHDKLREGVMTLLSESDRRRLHRQVAEILEDVHPEEEYSLIICDHYEQAGELARAAVWHTRAGKYAQQTHVQEAAVLHYKKALDLWGQVGSIPPFPDSDEAPKLTELYYGLGRALHFQARYTEAGEAFNQMRALSRNLNDLARAWNGLAETQLRQGGVRAALESVSQAESAARLGNDQLQLAIALWVKGIIQFRLGDLVVAQSLGEQVVAICREIGHQGRTAHGLNLIGAAHYATGQYDQATERFEEALTIFKEIGDRAAATPLMNNLGVLAFALGNYQGAFQRYHEALAAAREVGDRDAELVYRCNLGGTRAAMGDYSGAEADLRAIIRDTGDTGLTELSEAHCFLAEACLGQRKLAEALDEGRKALALGRGVESQEYISAAWRVLGQIADQMGQPISIDGVSGYSPAICFVQGLQVCQDMPVEQARTLRAWAEYESAHGDKTKGLAMWQQAKEIFARIGAAMEVERMAGRPGMRGHVPW